MTTAPGFRGLGLGPNYRSEHSDLVGQLFQPLLERATDYARAVGYFSSGSLAAVADGLDTYAQRGGTVRLIASPHLSRADVEEIERGYAFREVLERSVVSALDADISAHEVASLGLLGSLIAKGQLNIKLAYVRRGESVGIYHEKIGFFRDANGDVVAMSGSANETYSGLLANFETVEVYRSWEPGDDRRAARIVEDFERLWSNTTAGLAVIDFPEAARRKLIEYAEQSATTSGQGGPQTLKPPLDLEPRPYQRDAVLTWLRNSGRGILKMATGTGKTKTALFAASQIARVQREREQPLALLIIAPYQHLVDQWIEELSRFGVRGLGIYEDSDRWLPLAQRQIEAATLGEREIVALVATNASFSLARFQSLLRSLNLTLIVIADEAHNLGSERFVKLLPANATYRLALSATPERWFDEWGTAALVDYFGPVVYELGLGEAIDMGALCHYRYLPRLVELTADETALYQEISVKIAALLASGEDLDDPDSPIGNLLRRRAGVLGHAEGKLPLLKLDITNRASMWAQLIYCAEGRRPQEDSDESGPTQIEQVISLVGVGLGLSIHPYTSETPRALRPQLLRRFTAERDLRFLAAMRCLDEGVDIPDARLAYLLASSSNPRQFIQRRGRILRPAPGKTHAEILDYLAYPSAEVDSGSEIERSLMRRELARAAEFAKLADNYGEALEVLRPLKERYDLIDL